MKKKKAVTVLDMPLMSEKDMRRFFRALGANAPRQKAIVRDMAWFKRHYSNGL